MNPKHINSLRLFLEEEPQQGDLSNGYVAPIRESNLKLLLHIVSEANNILHYHPLIQDNDMPFNDTDVEKISNGYAGCLTIKLNREQECLETVVGFLEQLQESLPKVMQYYSMRCPISENNITNLQNEFDDVSTETDSIMMNEPNALAILHGNYEQQTPNHMNRGKTVNLDEIRAWKKDQQETLNFYSKFTPDNAGMLGLTPDEKRIKNEINAEQHDQQYHKHRSILILNLINGINTCLSQKDNSFDIPSVN